MWDGIKDKGWFFCFFGFFSSLCVGDFFFGFFYSMLAGLAGLAGFCLRLEKWNRILGIICLLISTLTRIKLYYQKASVRTEDRCRTDAGQMLFFQYCVVLKP